MIILKWWIIMNKSLPHFLNGGKCITEGGLQPSCSLSAVRGGFSREPLWRHPPPLLSRLPRYKLQACRVSAALTELFPGDLAVYISHSNSFCAQWLSLPLWPPPLHPLLLFGPLAVLNPVFCLVFVVNLQTFSAWAKAQRKTSSFSDDWPLVVMGSTACCSLRTPDLLGNLETRISSNESCSDVEGKQNSRSFLLVVQKN